MTTITEKNLHADLEAIRADIAALAENVGKIAGEASKAQAAMGKAVSKVASASARSGTKMWGAAGDLGHDTGQAVADAAHVGISHIEQQIRQKPMSSALIALGIGIFAAVIGLNFRK